MKNLYPIILLLFLSSSFLAAEESKPFPDLSKAFPTEKLFNQTKIEGIETYGYLTNLDFANLNQKFTEFLGKNWGEAEVDSEIKKINNQGMQDQGVEIEGFILFSSPDFPDVQISLAQMKMEIENKQFMAIITVIRSNGK